MNTYNKEYHEKIRTEESPAAERISDYIFNKFNPSSITDYGSSTGIYLKPFEKYNIKLKGLENSSYALQNKLLNEVEYCDLTIPLKLECPSNFSISLEVGEHIDEKYADIYIKNICDNTFNWVLFSAAIPGQSGVGHVNCQDKSYWIKKFEKNFFVCDYVETKEFLEYLPKGYFMGWQTQNCMILRDLF